MGEVITASASPVFKRSYDKMRDLYAAFPEAIVDLPITCFADPGFIIVTLADESSFFDFLFYN